MRRIDLYYQNINDCLLELRQELELYYEANSPAIESSDQRSTKYADFDTELDKTVQYLDFLLEKSELFEDFSIIDEFLTSYRAFVGLFSDFPKNYELTIQYWITIAKKLTSVKEPDIDLTLHIDEVNFRNNRLDEKIIDSDFIYYDDHEIKRSIIIFTLNGNINNFLDTDIHSAHTDILFLWLYKLDLKFVIPETQFVIFNLEGEIELPELKSILKLQVLLNGKHIKTLVRYEKKPAKPHLKHFDYSKKYMQFDNVSNVLNEYNNQYFLLDKYLKLYHIIENFMYKHKICNLQIEKIGSPFHIRDFQTIYDKFRTNETQCIHDFFIEVFKLDYNGDKILRLIQNEWANLEGLNAAMPGKIDLLFPSLNLNKRSFNYNFLKSNIDGGLFSTLIYKFRNAIVHNKDSEAHFESTNLPESAKFLLEEFLIPNLERIVFHLIINKNDLVWYTSKEINLY